MFKSKSISTRLALLTTAVLSVCCIILVCGITYSVCLKLEQISLPANDNVEIAISTEYLLQSMRIEGLAYLIIIILAGSLAVWFLVHKFLRPVQELSEHMRETTTNTLSRTIDIGTHSDEITELVNSFNTMSQQLDEAFAMQKRFSAHAAHELRTPLAVIQTKLEVFAMKERSKEEYEALFEVINTQTKRLSSLVKSLLELTEIGDLPLDEEIFLPDILEEVAADLAPVGEKKEISIHFFNPVSENHEQKTDGDLKNPPCILGNHLLLYRVFYNLVENAIRYNHNGGQVELSFQTEEDMLCVQVADTGDGIPDEHKAHIFEAFYRVDKSRSRALGGAGIGLSFVENILERHKASIFIKDREGGGTIFEIHFPVSPTDR